MVCFTSSRCGASAAQCVRSCSTCALVSVRPPLSSCILSSASIAATCFITSDVPCVRRRRAGSAGRLVGCVEDGCVGVGFCPGQRSRADSPRWWPRQCCWPGQWRCWLQLSGALHRRLRPSRKPSGAYAARRVSRALPGRSLARGSGVEPDVPLHLRCRTRSSDRSRPDQDRAAPSGWRSPWRRIAPLGLGADQLVEARRSAARPGCAPRRSTEPRQGAA